MCDYINKAATSRADTASPIYCQHVPAYWVQARGNVNPQNAPVANALVCGAHLPYAVRDIGIRVDEFNTGRTYSECANITVKRRKVNPVSDSVYFE